ncbi:unnamed protein product [Larinioides sclopetarius]|uniref:NudC domain-containing protein 3 n=1 Tax=Larinioides sclopetarius TaxID=280406 RepID=A0AAV1ZMV5_9ARAC
MDPDSYNGACYEGYSWAQTIRDTDIHIKICLQKIRERWWDSFFIGEPKINLRAIDPSIPYEDLDQESQAKIKELMYNEHLKRLGKPTIQQSKIQDMLKDAWDRDGSPFKGQPFDPSAVDLSAVNGST